RALVTADAAELVLPDLNGDEFRLATLGGQKVVIASWAPYLGCRSDPSGGQALRSELHPKGLEVVTVGIETSGTDACREFIELAQPEHPSLIDATHQMEARFGVVNIPNVVWIDENGVIVRPPEPGWPGPTQYPEFLARRVRAAAKKAERAELTPEEQRERDEQRAMAERVRSIISGGQDRDAYPDAI